MKGNDEPIGLQSDLCQQADGTLCQLKGLACQ